MLSCVQGMNSSCFVVFPFIDDVSAESFKSLGYISRRVNLCQRPGCSIVATCVEKKDQVVRETGSGKGMRDD